MKLWRSSRSRRLMGGSNPEAAPWLAIVVEKSHSTECLTQLRHDGRASSHYGDRGSVPRLSWNTCHGTGHYTDSVPRPALGNTHLDLPPLAIPTARPCLGVRLPPCLACRPACRRPRCGGGHTGRRTPRPTRNGRVRPAVHHFRVSGGKDSGRVESEDLRIYSCGRGL